MVAPPSSSALRTPTFGRAPKLGVAQSADVALNYQYGTASG
jgi:hypothetical protein